METKHTRLFEGSSLTLSGEYVERQTYDEMGRVFQAFDASGGDRGLRHLYDAQSGQLRALREAREGAAGVVVWELQAVNARGQATHGRLGNGTEVYASYDEQTGRLQNLLDTHGTQRLQSLALAWDRLGNLRWRQDSSGNRNQSECFYYDARNFLEATGDPQGQPCPAQPGATVRQSQSYDPAACRA